MDGGEGKPRVRKGIRNFCRETFQRHRWIPTRRWQKQRKKEKANLEKDSLLKRHIIVIDTVVYLHTSAKIIALSLTFALFYILSLSHSLPERKEVKPSLPKGHITSHHFGAKLQFSKKLVSRSQAARANIDEKWDANSKTTKLFKSKIPWIYSTQLV